MLQVGGALPTKVVCLTQVISADELRDDEEYEDILEDMREEGRKYVHINAIAVFYSGLMQYWQTGLTYRRHTILYQFDLI
jgi:hypothetical protein